MPRIRSIKPEFWTDPKLGRVSRDARMLYIGSWTFCDDFGVVCGDPEYLKSRIFPYDKKVSMETFQTWIDELISIGRFKPFDVEGEIYFFLPKFQMHQFIQKPSQRRNPEPPAKFIKVEKKPVEDISEPPPEPDIPEGVEPDSLEDGKLPEDLPPADQAADLKYEAIVELWNSTVHGLPKVTQMPDSRRRTLSARWKAHPDLSWWLNYFERIHASDFICGRTGNGAGKWASFDWVLKPANMAKILEGNYDNSQRFAVPKSGTPGVRAADTTKYD